jgi:drug/metabolite transporter (DMT)-like permease
MEPNEALGIAAQVAVALAGFAGVVVVFRPDSVHTWSRLDRTRLQLLLHNSLCPLAYALFGMLLLTIKPTPVWIWRECSLFGLLFQMPGGIIAFRNARVLTPEEKKHTSRTLLYGIGAMGALTQLLQVWNIATLNQFWPFFLAIVMHLMAGMLQFTRMVLLLPQKE